MPASTIFRRLRQRVHNIRCRLTRSTGSDAAITTVRSTADPGDIHSQFAWKESREGAIRHLLRLMLRERFLIRKRSASFSSASDHLGHLTNLGIMPHLEYPTILGVMLLCSRSGPSRHMRAIQTLSIQS